MKKYILTLVLCLSLPVWLFGVDLEQYAMQNLINHGDKVKVDTCNLDNWCKVVDKPWYINGKYFEKEIDGFFVMNDNTEQHTHFYEKKLTTDSEIIYEISRRVDEDRYIFPGDVVLAEFCDEHGWCKVDRDDTYVKLSMFVIVDANNYKTMKLKDNIEHAHYYKKHANQTENYDTYSIATAITGEHDLVIVEECNTNDKTQHDCEDNSKLNELLDDDAYDDPNILGNYYFVYAGVGFSKYSIKDEIQNTILFDEALDEHTPTAHIGFGLVHSGKLFSTFGIYKSLGLERATVTDLLYSFNYKFVDAIDAKPYVGVVFGMSELVWDKKPNDTPAITDVKTTGYAIGIQVGLDSKFSNTTSIYTQLRYLSKTITTEIGNEELSHQGETGLSLGLRLHF